MITLVDFPFEVPQLEPRLTSTAELKDAMRLAVSRSSFAGPIRVDLTDGQTLYLSYVTFHEDSLYFSCAKPKRSRCRFAKPTHSGGSLGLSDVATGQVAWR